MYEVGMSANSRVEPVFEPEIKQWEGQAPVSLGADHLIYEEETYNGFSGLLLKSGLVILLAVSSYGGYQFLTASNGIQSAESKARYDWSGKPIDENERLRLTGVKDPTNKIRKIDLTQTGSVKKDANAIGKPVPATPATSTGVKFHVVQSGDTLSAIGRKFKISAADIMEINAIEDARRIKPGMKLVISR